MTFRRIEQLGLGQLGLLPDELYDLNLREFFNKLTGFYELKESEIRTTYEAARLTATIVLNSMTDKVINPQDVVRFPWEEQKKFKVMDKDLYNERLKKVGWDNSIGYTNK